MVYRRGVVEKTEAYLPDMSKLMPEEDVIKIAEKIKKAIEDRPTDLSLYQDLFSLTRDIADTRRDDKYHRKRRYPKRDLFEHETNRWLLRRLETMLRLSGGKEEWFELWRNVLTMEASVDFDSYLQRVELDRPASQTKFYLPRRPYLRRNGIVQGFQDIADGKIRFLSVSMPKRSGKSQTGINFVNWLSGQNPGGSSLMEGTGDALVKSFYNGCLEYLLTPSDYSFYDIFPNAKLVQTNADDKIINLNKKSRFPTIMCRSIDSRQVGLSEATNVLYLDDCVEGREEAKNRQRLEDKWEIISGDIMGRAIEGTPIVICGTRYSVYDPIGKMQEFAERQGWTWRAIEVPALDPQTDESNYEYTRDGAKVFTTAYFREQRDLLSEEQWESEFQQHPFEARGLLFGRKELNYYTQLPDREPDAVVSQADTADTGEDYMAQVVAKIYGDDIYIDDVVFDSSPASVTKPESAQLLIRNKVSAAEYESNNAGEYYMRDVDLLLKEAGYHCGMRAKRTVTNKQTRIEFASDNIKRYFWFRDPTTYQPGSQYDQFMRNLTTYVRTGKVPHDDAPDVLSMLENALRTTLQWKSSVEVFDRPF